MKLLRSLGLLLVAALLGVSAEAQYTSPYVILQGYLTTASGIPAKNDTLTFQPSQAFFVAGTQVVVLEAQCATDVSGQIVSIGNPLQPARVSPQLTGSLPAGNYYVKFTWYDQFNTQTLASPEVAIQLTATGELQILPPVGDGPPNATGMNVYIGTAPSQETYQGHTTSTTALYTQAVALTTGAALPISNTTSCRVVANDAALPTGTGYMVSLLDSSGNSLFSYPEMWQFFGPGSSYNLSQGIPYYHGQVTYPSPILATPYNHNLQSISGPLSMGLPGVYYPITGVQALGVDTNTPGWGIDVEGSGLLGLVNAAGGYLVNGNGGIAGECLVSDGTAYDTPAACVTSLPAIYYQQVLNGSHLSDAVPQQGYLAVGTGTGLVASNVIGVGSQVSRTVLNVNATASLSTDPFIVNTAAAGTSGNCMKWDSIGGAGDSGGPCTIGTSVTSSTGQLTVPASPAAIIFKWGVTPTFDTGPITISFSTPFPHGCLAPPQLTDNRDVSPTSRIWQSGSCTASSFLVGNDGNGSAWWVAIGW